MQTTIHTTGSIELNPKLREYVEKKAEMLTKYLGAANDSTAMCKVELGMVTEGQNTGDVFKAEIGVAYTGNSHYYEATASTIEKAIDKAKDEMKRELQRSRKKERHVFRRGAQAMKDFMRGFRKD